MAAILVSKKRSAKMRKNRLVYQNWIVELGFDPAQIRKLFDTVAGDSSPDAETDMEVRRAIEGLDEEEMEFVIRFYFMGDAYNEISEKSGRSVHKLEALNKRAIRKLKSRLQAFVKRRYGLKFRKGGDCPLCESPHRAAINEIIANRNGLSTWKPVLKEINKQFGLKINSPQVLIGHQKYHR